MYTLIIVLVLAGPECDSWFEQYFTVTCATSTGTHVREREFHFNRRGRSGNETPDDNGGTPSGGNGGSNGGSNGGGTPTPEPPAGDHNKGHGNDPGKHDNDNPGKGNGNGRNR